MKKVSTAATRQSRNISRQQLTIGLNLGDRNSWYCVLDEGGRIQLEQRLGTTAKAMQEVLGAMTRSRVALEIGMHSPWIMPFAEAVGANELSVSGVALRWSGRPQFRKPLLGPACQSGE